MPDEGAGGLKEEENSRKSVTWSAVPHALISFLDVYFSVSFVVRGQRPRRGQ